MAEDDDTVRRTPKHIVGEPLDDLSVAECGERIAQLQLEIERLDQARARKRTALTDAGAVFKV